jgi:5-methylcytosine-specific restriction endonuclease McrA
MPHATTKRCTKCGETKARSDFSQGKAQCKPCVAIVVRERRHTDPDFHDRQVESQRRSWTARRADPAFIEAERARLREYQREQFRDPEWKQQRSDYYRVYNKRPDQRRRATDYERTRRQEKQRTDPQYHAHLMDLAKRGWHKRRALLAQSGGSYTRAEWDWLCALYDHRCVRCGADGPLSVDHVVPLSKGGGNGIDNLQPLCRSCNSRKHTDATDYRPFAPPTSDPYEGLE